MFRLMTDRTPVVASSLIVAIGILWGLYWIPVREIGVHGLPGAWSTAAITLAAGATLAPFALRNGALRSADPVALISITLGGAAFAFYSIGFIYGRVALVVLLFYLTPVWSTLLTRYIFGWNTPRLRIVAMAIGLVGLLVMLGAKGDAPIPRNLGEWMGLLSGILWAIGSTGIRVRKELGPVPAAFAFALGAAITAVCCGLLIGPLPFATAVPDIATVLIWSVITGLLWWVLTVPLLMWATARLDPARVGILLMSEVLIGILSAAIIAGEHISLLEIIGGALVISAALLELWPTQTKQGH